LAARMLRQVCATTLLALTVVGCSLFRGPPPVTYELTAPDSIPQLRSGTAAQIMIPEPRALKALDTERVVVASGPTISYYPDVQLADRLPKVFQAKALEAFEQSKRARAVGLPGEGLSIDYQLLIEIRSFQFVSLGKSGFARIEISAKILNDRNGRVVATKTLTSQTEVVSDDAPHVVAAVDTALNEVLVELVRWTVGNV
jgi:cholesterol transport system auxiliary component